jgi:hypothetical protein
MHSDSELLNLFRAALTGDPIAFDVFCDALEDDSHLLALFAREVSRATPIIPADFDGVYEPEFLARGTNWRIEYRPGRRAERIHPSVPLVHGGQNAEVGEVYEGDGPWTQMDGVATRLAPAGVHITQTTFYALQEEVTIEWVRLAFDAVRLNMVGHLLVGHQVAMVTPKGNAIAPIVAPIDHRLNWLRAYGL